MRRILLTDLSSTPLPAPLSLRLRDEPESGPPPATAPLLCLHGAAMSSVVYMDLLRRLTPGLRVIAPDLPGHGQSRPALSQAADAAVPLSIDGYRDVVLALMDRLALPRAILVGHSMGAAIALRLALFRPERVAGLVLLNGAARLRVSAEVLALLARELPADPVPDAQDPEAAAPATSEAMPEALAALMFSPRTVSALRERWSAVLVGAPRSVAVADFRACDGFDVRAQLPGLRVPALIVSGEEDLMVPARLSDEVERLIPGAQRLRVPATGHLSHLEAPELVSEAIAAFARQT